jgi:hypothetical protein
MFEKPMDKMCDNCPFGNSPEQLHLRRSFRRGRFDEICQSVLRGFIIFICHKTTSHNDEDEWTPTSKDRECAGSIRFRENAIANRERAERRGRK